MKFVDLLARFADVTEQTDGGYLALCPAHDDSRPSLRIWRGDDNKVRLTCRAGCVPDAVVTAAGLVWPDMFNATGEGLTVPKEPPALVDTRHVAALAQYVDQTSMALGDYGCPTAELARTYLRDRFGLDMDTAAELMLGVDAPHWALPFPHRSTAYRAFPRLTVPLVGFDGMVRGLQGRDLSGECPGRWISLSNPDGARWAPYGTFRGQGGYGVALVTEGPGDGLTAVAVGYNAVAVRGAALAANPALLADLAEGLRGSQVIVCGDNDESGLRFNRALAEGLWPFGIEVYELCLPDLGPKTDITEWRKSDPLGFPLALHSAVKAARPVRDSAEAEAAAVSAELTDRTGADTVSRDQGAEAAKILAGLISRYGESDAMNAHSLVAWTDGRIKYAPGLGFYVWNGRTWERSEVKVRQEVHRMGAALILAGEIAKAKPFTMTTRIDSLLTELRSVPSVHVDASAFDACPDLLTFRNGTVDLRSGILRPHDKRDMMTVAIDLDYDRSATAPRWESFIEEIMPGMPEMPSYLRRLVGYGISGHTSEQCFAVLWGTGANGKSVFTDTLTEVFSAITQTTPFATFEDKGSGGIPNDIAALRGARLVMASEGESGKPMSEAVLKRVTGKDKVTARFLRQEFFTFAPTFLIMLATNHKPAFRGQDEGLWRRVKMIPFRRYFAPEERDYGLGAKLLAEAPGIVAWAVRGAVEWYADGLADPAPVRNATREYRETSDALSGFCPGVVEVTGDDSDTMLGNECFSAYLDWCEAENLDKKERWRRTTFYRAMEERKVKRRKTERGITLFGLRLTDAASAADGPGIFAN
ncbi:phage/plasmid primase, P4 family [Streptomyces noursei]|uniref:phage/plasmid primase, P4 family n=1 Tax=Streptomyces noursei TaxID=1971 RepID=UPI0037FA698E